MFRLAYRVFGITSREVALGAIAVLFGIVAGWAITAVAPVQAYLQGGGIVSIPFFLLSGLAIQLRLKQVELTEHAGLNHREALRLVNIVEERNRRLNFLIIFYVLSGIFIAVAPILAGLSNAGQSVSIAIIAIIVISLIALGRTLSGWAELDRFKMKLDQKIKEHEERDRLLRKLRNRHS